MADKANEKKIHGTAYWAKLVDPVPNYNKDGYQWEIDVAVDEKTAEELREIGLGPKLKDNKEYSPYIQFKRATVKKAGPKAGEANKPVRVVSSDGKTEWDPKVLIGNGSEVNVKFNINDVVGGPQKKKFRRADILSLQVWKLKEYKKAEAEFEVNDEPDVEVKTGTNW